MRPTLQLSALLLAVLSFSSVAYGDDDAAGTPPPGGTAGSTPGKGGTSAGGTSAGGTSAGGTSAGGRSAGGTSAGGTSAGGTSAGGTSAGGTSAGGTDAGGAHSGGSHSGGAGAGGSGASGSDAGSGGSGGASGGSAGTSAAGAGGGAAVDPIDLAGCTFATAMDGLSGPQTITVGVGGSKYTPKCLKVKKGTEITWDGNSGTHPLKRFTTKGTEGNPIPVNGSETVIKVTFAAVGTFGYYCGNHGGDGSSSGMVGAIYVVE